MKVFVGINLEPKTILQTSLLYIVVLQNAINKTKVGKKGIFWSFTLQTLSPPKEAERVDGIISVNGRLTDPLSTKGNPGRRLRITCKAIFRSANG